MKQGKPIKCLFLTPMRKQIIVSDVGTDQSYQKIWDVQEVLLQQNVQLKAAAKFGANPLLSNVEEKVDGGCINRLLLVEHKPVYTLGKSGDASHILINDEERMQRGIEYFKINRGGDITFHGPGQLVGYPILDLEQFKTDLGWYLRNLEEVIIRTMAFYGLKGDRSPGETGVWLDPETPGRERKICAMGIRCSRWITMHGFAFNVNTDLNYFNHIIPCGIEDKQVTSLQKELGYAIPMQEVKVQLLRNFEEIFDVDVTSLEGLPQ